MVEINLQVCTTLSAHIAADRAISCQEFTWGCNIKHFLLGNAGLHIDENLGGGRYVASSN